MLPIFQDLIQQYPRLVNLNDPLWRLTNLYWIRDKSGNRVKFSPNWAQKILLEDLHPLKIVLKCRQIGITTFFSLLLLDKALFEENIQCGIIAQTFDDASNIFKDKLKFAFDCLDPAIRPFFKLQGDSAKELSFAHGSKIRVGTSLRSTTLQYLHISEFGKICCKDPERALEVVTGSLQTVSSGQHIYIESTAEGSQGFYHDMVQRAFSQEKSGVPFSFMDYKPYFFPWWKEPDYSMDINETSRA